MPLSHFLCAMLALIVALLLDDSVRSEAEIQRDHYCEMIEIYERSGGEYGWPDDGRECE